MSDEYQPIRLWIEDYGGHRNTKIVWFHKNRITQDDGSLDEEYLKQEALDYVEREMGPGISCKYGWDEDVDPNGGEAIASQMDARARGLLRIKSIQERVERAESAINAASDDALRAAEFIRGPHLRSDWSDGGHGHSTLDLIFKDVIRDMDVRTALLDDDGRHAKASIRRTEYGYDAIVVLGKSVDVMDERFSLKSEIRLDEPEPEESIGVFYYDSKAKSAIIQDVSTRKGAPSSGWTLTLDDSAVEAYYEDDDVEPLHERFGDATSPC